MAVKEEQRRSRGEVWGKKGISDLCLSSWSLPTEGRPTVCLKRLQEVYLTVDSAVLGQKTLIHAVRQIDVTQPVGDNLD